PGWKFAEYEFRGVPLRIAIGPRDLEKGQVGLARRVLLQKSIEPMEGLVERIPGMLEDIQKTMFEKARTYRDAHITRADTWEEFVDLLENKGGFISAHWDGTSETEEEIKNLTKATIRCIPLDNPQEEGRCIRTGKPSKQRVLFAMAY